MEFLKLLLGETFNINDWIFAFVLAIMGFMLLKLVTFNRRTDKTSSFNPYYWWKDNKIEFIAGLIMFYMEMRFFDQILNFVNEYLSFQLTVNRFLFVFLSGLFFNIILKKARSILKIRQKTYENGEDRIESQNDSLRSSHVGNRPDER